MYCNSCVNPFIYNHASKDFRDGFRDVMSRWGLNVGRGTALTSGQAAARLTGDTGGTGRQRARDDAGEANNEGDNEIEANELTDGGVYCGPKAEHIQMELHSHSASVTYV